MTVEAIVERAAKILATIEEKKYPETCSTLKGIAEECYYLSGAYEVVEMLYDCDKCLELAPEAAELIKQICTEEIEQGNHDAMCDLGSLYYTGRIGEQNYEKAVRYYTMAARLGNRQATENLGYCYYYGRLGKVDHEKAFHYFLKGGSGRASDLALQDRRYV